VLDCVDSQDLHAMKDQCLPRLDGFHIISNLPDHCKGLRRSASQDTSTSKSTGTNSLARFETVRIFTVG